MSFTGAKKTGLIDFPEKKSSDLSKIFTTSLPNFSEFHRSKRKIIYCQFCFFYSCLRHKTSKNADIFLRGRAD